MIKYFTRDIKDCAWYEVFFWTVVSFVGGSAIGTYLIFGV